MTETQMAATYPTEDQYEQWKDEAEEFGMSTSEFMKSMIEAGMKKFEVSVEPDETNQELREHRNDLKKQLEESRERVKRLEERTYSGERAVIRREIEENPGISFAEIAQRLVETVPGRINRYLDEMEGDSLRIEDDHYFPAEGSEVDGS